MATRRGRPPRDEGAATCRIAFRCTDRERREIQHYARRSGLSMSEYCRLTVLVDELSEADLLFDETNRVVRH